MALNSMYGNATAAMPMPQKKKKAKKLYADADRVGSPNLEDAAKLIKKRKEAQKKQLEELDS